MLNVRSIEISYSSNLLYACFLVHYFRSMIGAATVWSSVAYSVEVLHIRCSSAITSVLCKHAIAGVREKHRCSTN